MATWVEIRGALAQHQIVKLTDALAVVICSAPGLASWPVSLRVVRAHDSDWLQLDACICKVGEASLENVLRQTAKEVLGSVVIAQDECLLRERVLLAPLTLAELNPLLAMVIARAAQLQSQCRVEKSRSSYEMYDHLIT